MNLFLLDTNVVSILFKADHPQFGHCLDVVSGHQQYISFMTRGELLCWPRLNNWGPARSERLDRHIDQYTTLLPEEHTCAIWAEVRVQSTALGRPMSTADAWIAAIARQWRLPLITANYRDFDHLDDLAIIPIHT